MKVGVYWNQSMFQPLSPGQTPHRASWTPSVKGATSSRPQEGSGQAQIERPLKQAAENVESSPYRKHALERGGRSLSRKYPKPNGSGRDRASKAPSGKGREVALWKYIQIFHPESYRTWVAFSSRVLTDLGRIRASKTPSGKGREVALQKLTIDLERSPTNIYRWLFTPSPTGLGSRLLLVSYHFVYQSYSSKFILQRQALKYNC